MAKLITNTNTALMGTGMNVLAKLVSVSEIKTIPELENIFQKQEKVVEKIKESMREDGFHKEEPIVIAKLTDGTVLGVADGHTRLMVAREIGLDEVPAVYKTFDSIADAIQYAKDRQFHRRNLSQAEIYGYANSLEAVEERTGEGRASERLAEELGVSASTIEHARTVESRADEDTKEKVRNNEMSINQAYQKVRQAKNKPDEDDGSDEDDTDDISDGLEDTDGNPREVHVHSRDMGERFSPPEESDIDRRMIERFKDGFYEGFRKGFGEGSYQIFDRISALFAEGKAWDEVQADDVFSDFTFSEVSRKLELPSDMEHILKEFNR